MNNFIFENSSKVYFGEGCVKEYLSSILSAYGDTVMLCYGGGSIKKSGIYDEVITVLKKENKAVVEFSGIPSNPTYSKVLEGVKLAKESNADLILAVGGGSVMDCCKAISLGAKYDADIWADFWARLGVIDFELLPLGIIVTVSGTGSECNGGAVITNEELKIKTGKDYPQLNAKFVICSASFDVLRAFRLNCTRGSRRCYVCAFCCSSRTQYKLGKAFNKRQANTYKNFSKYSCFACAYIICRLNRQRGNCFKASVCIFEYKINLCSEQNPYAFCILGIYIYVAPPRTSFQYDFANDKKEKATLTKSEDCFQNNIHTHFCIRNLRIIQTGYSILPVPEKSVFPPWR